MYCIYWLCIGYKDNGIFKWPCREILHNLIKHRTAEFCKHKIVCRVLGKSETRTTFTEWMVRTQTIRKVGFSGQWVSFFITTHWTVVCKLLMTHSLEVNTLWLSYTNNEFYKWRASKHRPGIALYWYEVRFGNCTSLRNMMIISIKV